MPNHYRLCLCLVSLFLGTTCYAQAKKHASIYCPPPHLIRVTQFDRLDKLAAGVVAKRRMPITVRFMDERVRWRMSMVYLPNKQSMLAIANAIKDKVSQPLSLRAQYLQGQYVCHYPIAREGMKVILVADI